MHNHALSLIIHSFYTQAHTDYGIYMTPSALIFIILTDKVQLFYPVVQFVPYALVGQRQLRLKGLLMYNR